MARRAVQTVVAEAVRAGVEYRREAITSHDRSQTTIYACGPWLPKIFPELLAERIRVTRQEVFFFGTPRGDASFAPPCMPVWIDITDEHGAYTIPDLESRGFKLAFDRHGPQFDPDSDDRTVRGLDAARAFLAERFPGLAGAPLVESRVCQYENTSNGDFLLDRHPEFDNVWLAGGGSGHGFKHGPAVGEYIRQRIDGEIAHNPKFSLATKTLERNRSVY
jgi:glycine/D-amino acid oxidase-like deaminating enzyme